jgi:hypothetical protein
MKLSIYIVSILILVFSAKPYLQEIIHEEVSMIESSHSCCDTESDKTDESDSCCDTDMDNNCNCCDGECQCHGHCHCMPGAALFISAVNPISSKLHVHPTEVKTSCYSNYSSLFHSLIWHPPQAA